MTYKKEMADAAAYDLTSSDTTFVISNVRKLKSWTFEIILDAVGYPAAENDAEFTIEQSIGGVEYFEIPGLSAQSIAPGDNLIFNIVDISANYLRVSYTKNNLNAGTITKISPLGVK